VEHPIALDVLKTTSLNLPTHVLLSVLAPSGEMIPIQLIQSALLVLQNAQVALVQKSLNVEDVYRDITCSYQHAIDVIQPVCNALEALLLNVLHVTQQWVIIIYRTKTLVFQHVEVECIRMLLAAKLATLIVQLVMDRVKVSVIHVLMDFIMQLLVAKTGVISVMLLVNFVLAVEILIVRYVILVISWMHQVLVRIIVLIRSMEIAGLIQVIECVRHVIQTVSFVITARF